MDTFTTQDTEGDDDPEQQRGVPFELPVDPRDLIVEKLNVALAAFLDEQADLAA